MGRRVEYTLLFTNPAGTTFIGDGLGEADPTTGTPGWLSIDLDPRYNEVGTGSFTASALPELMSVLAIPEARVVVMRDGLTGDGPEVEMSGVIEDTPLSWQLDRDGMEGFGTVTVRFSEDDSLIAERIVFPSPLVAITAQTVARYSVTAVNAETAIRDLVNLNAGPGALSARRVPGLVLGPAAGVGTNVTTSFRFLDLYDALRKIALIGGGLGFRTRQVGRQIQFSVYQPRDLTEFIVFARSLGNVASIDFDRAVPKSTVAIVGDAQAGVNRVIRERINATAIAAGYRRREQFVDGRSAQNAGELDQAGDERLADDGPSRKLNIVAIETPELRYGYDYGIGDRVTYDLSDFFPGLTGTDIVRGVSIRVTPEKGEVVTPLIGAEGDALLDAKAAELEALNKRISQLEGSL